MKYSIMFAATLAASTADAFKVYLYTDPNCAGEEDAVVTVSLAHNQCSKAGVGVASSALVKAEAGDNQSDSMLPPLFYFVLSILKHSMVDS
jgi:hypothetical protein